MAAEVEIVRRRRGRPPFEITGLRSGKLVAVERGKNGYWLCDCDPRCGGCGKKNHPVRTSHLTRGTVRSCGCDRSAANKKTSRKFHKRAEKIIKLLDEGLSYAKAGAKVGVTDRRQAYSIVKRYTAQLPKEERNAVKERRRKTEADRRRESERRKKIDHPKLGTAYGRAYSKPL